MTTKQQNTEPRQYIVKTVLSPEAVRSLEFLLHWYWDNIDHDMFTPTIMEILGVYIKYCPEDANTFMLPDYITPNFISRLIELNKDIGKLIEKENPSQWEEGDAEYEYAYVLPCNKPE